MARSKIPGDVFGEQLTLGADVIDIADWANKSKRIKSKTVPNKRFTLATDEAVQRMRDGDWEGTGTLTFIGLYAYLHNAVYGCEPGELGPTERLRAAGMARRMLDRDFDGDAAAMADFMRWCWKRESDREKWRRETGNEGGRISWMLQFGGKLLTDYRVDLARAKARR